MSDDDDLLSHDTTEFEIEAAEWEAEHDRCVALCAKKIMACFADVSRELDAHEAWGLFELFVKVSRPKRKKGAHDPIFDAELLAAHDGAPNGQKTAAVQAVGRKHKKSAEATRKHLHRLLGGRKRLAAAFNAWAEDK